MEYRRTWPSSSGLPIAIHITIDLTYRKRPKRDDLALQVMQINIWRITYV